MLAHLSGLDASFLYAESDAMPMHTLKIGVFEVPEDVDRDTLLAEVAAHLALVPALRDRLIRVPLDLFHPLWWPADVDAAAHVDVVSLPDAGALDALIARIAEGMLPRDRPLWHLTLARGLPGGRVAAILKLHHAVAD